MSAFHQVSESDRLAPWRRASEQMPIPKDLTVGALRALSDSELWWLVRGHLLPTNPQDKTRWKMLWRLLGVDDGLVDRVYDVLEDQLHACDAAPVAQLDPKDAGRLKAHRARLQQAWDRLEKTERRPLAWAGAAADHFNEAGRQTIAQLVGAITRHRSAVLRNHETPSDDDKRLWDSLRRVNLDPRMLRIDA